MVLLYIKGVEEKEKQNFQHTVDLYGRQLKVTDEQNEDTEMTLSFSSSRDQTRGILLGEETELSYTYYPSAAFTQEVPDSKEIKRRKLHVTVQLLNNWFHTEQPWGLLTGMRPTKLWHQWHQGGAGPEDIKHWLLEDYIVTPEKAELLTSIALKQQEVLPDIYELSKGVSIYIGIPFCPTKCAYCTFPAYAMNGRNGSVVTFLEGLHYEMEETGRWLKENNVPVDTIYFGGGTPTSITAEEMDTLYSHMYEVIPDIENIREITVEAGRPDTITPEKLDVLKKWNIDRISINPQSFTNETLKAIGRHHSVEETIDKYKLAKVHGMNNINMDLIIGLPNEGMEEMAHSLTETEKLLPESVTVHTLSFKKASEMTRQKNKYKVAEPAEVEQMMNLSSQWMADHSYEPYYLYRQKNILGNQENVGYSFKGKESLYNIIIMEELQTIIGLGCGAASKWVDPETGRITRFANPKDPISYIQSYGEYTVKKLDTLSGLFPASQKA